MYRGVFHMPLPGEKELGAGPTILFFFFLFLFEESHYYKPLNVQGLVTQESPFFHFNVWGPTPNSQGPVRPL